MPPQKAYCFTCNNYSEDEYSNLVRTCETESRYAILGKEIGESGTPHIQGYIRFKKPYRFSTITDRFLPRCHIQVASGSARANRLYCSKDGSFVEFGECPTEGGKSRDEIAIRFREAMAGGRSGLSQFANEQPGTYMYSGHNLLRNFLVVQPCIERPEIDVTWIHGPPGVGKSKKAHEDMPDAYVKDPRTKWWNGYLLEKNVIIDDFGPQGIDINHLLRWFDRYKCLVESKGGMLPLYAVKFIVTSNFTPESVFTCNLGVVHPQLPALMRRINVIELC